MHWKPSLWATLTYIYQPARVTRSHGERKRCELPWGQRSPWNQPQWQVLPLVVSPAEWLDLQAAAQSSGSRTKRQQIQISPVTLPPGE